jgi:Tfp pilus assembly protein FimT
VVAGVSSREKALEQVLNASPYPANTTLASARGWTLNQVLIGLVGAAVLMVIVVPGLVARRMRRRRR